SVVLAHGQYQHRQSHQLCGEGFSGSHTYLCSGPGHKGKIRLTHQRRSCYVTNGQAAEITQFFSQSQGCKGVGGFAGLADGYDQAVRLDEGFAIAKLAGDLNVTGNSSE